MQNLVFGKLEALKRRDDPNLFSVSPNSEIRIDLSEKTFNKSLPGHRSEASISRQATQLNEEGSEFRTEQDGSLTFKKRQIALRTNGELDWFFMPLNCCILI